MIVFKYSYDDEEIEGKVKIRAIKQPLEMKMETLGCSFHLIIGKHENGYFLCIPNWGIGSDIGHLSSYTWNYERLSTYTSLEEIFVIAIAKALYEVYRKIGDDWIFKAE